MDQYEILEVNLGKKEYICFELFEVWVLSFSLKEETMRNIHNRNMAKFSNSLLYAGIRYLLCRCRNFSLAFFFFKTFEAIASPLKLESSWQRMRNTVPYCLIEWAAKDILIYLKHLVFEKRLDLVLSSPKWSDSDCLLTTGIVMKILCLKYFQFLNICILLENTSVICIQI